jgi:putative DNA primase/helicase
LAAAFQAESENAETPEAGATALSSAAALRKRAGLLRQKGRADSVLALATDYENLGIEGSEWDADPWLLAVTNGVLDLRSGQLREGKPEDMLTRLAPTEWQGLDAPAPRWEQFVHEVLADESDRATFLQKALGYSLNGTTQEHILVLMHGKRGRNGKGACFETLTSVLGDYATTVSSDVLIGDSSHRVAGSAQPQLVQLRGARLALANETSDGAKMDAVTVKAATGGGEVRARDLYEKSVTFQQTHTLFVSTNSLPYAAVDDDALWSRILVVDFRLRYVDEPTTPDERKRNPKLAVELQAERSGVLAWLVRGHLAWQRDGLQPPQSVKLAVQSYRKGEGIDQFLADCCIVGRGRAEASELNTAYREWCVAKEVTAKGVNWLGKQLVAQFERNRTETGRRCYDGVMVSAEKMQGIMAQAQAVSCHTCQTLGDSGNFLPYSTHVEKSLESASSLTSVTNEGAIGEY